jgi:hypothetical protein
MNEVFICVGGILLLMVFIGCMIGGAFDLNEDKLFESPLDDTVGELLFRCLFLGIYIFVVPVYYIAVLFKFICNIKSLKNFFNKKPLEFLKNYSIKIEKK